MTTVWKQLSCNKYGDEHDKCELSLLTSLTMKRIGLKSMDDLLDDLARKTFELVGYKSYDHIAVPMLERNN
jgi:hypothetical protein